MIKLFLTPEEIKHLHSILKKNTHYLKVQIQKAQESGEILENPSHHLESLMYEESLSNDLIEEIYTQFNNNNNTKRS